MGAFADLLTEVQPRMRERDSLAFLWRPGHRIEGREWLAYVTDGFATGEPRDSQSVAYGRTGEEALRNLVAKLKESA